MDQNPAVTEPNQSAIRAGLYNLDLLVVRHVRDRDVEVSATGVVPDSAARTLRSRIVANSVGCRRERPRRRGNTSATRSCAPLARATDDASASLIKAVWDPAWHHTPASTKALRHPYGGYVAARASRSKRSAVVSVARPTRSVRPVPGRSGWQSDLGYLPSLRAAIWIYTGAYVGHRWEPQQL
jgi:hypothetical protein